MKFVINSAFGGFELPEDFIAQYNRKHPGYKMGRFGWISDEEGNYCEDIQRVNPDLIAYIEANMDEDHYLGDLQLVEIPNDITDWRIEEYDGSETLWYVRNGKMYSV